MIAYSIIMFLAAALLAGISMAVYRGNTNLIHDYHQTNVTDKAAYGKAFGKAMSVVSLAPLLSGIVGFLGEPETMGMIAVTVLIAGLMIGVACIIAVQKKYNNSLF